MAATDIKSQITAKLDRLSPRLLSIVNDFINNLMTSLTAEQQSPKSVVAPTESEDPLVGMIDGSPDLATNAENILHEEIKPASGWSWRQ